MNALWFLLPLFVLAANDPPKRKAKKTTTSKAPIATASAAVTSASAGPGDHQSSQCLGDAMVQLARVVVKSLNQRESLQVLRTNVMELCKVDTGGPMQALLASPAVTGPHVLHMRPLPLSVPPYASSWEGEWAEKVISHHAHHSIYQFLTSLDAGGLYVSAYELLSRQSLSVASPSVALVINLAVLLLLERQRQDRRFRAALVGLSFAYADDESLTNKSQRLLTLFIDLVTSAIVQSEPPASLVDDCIKISSDVSVLTPDTSLCAWAGQPDARILPDDGIDRADGRLATTILRVVIEPAMVSPIDKLLLGGFVMSTDYANAFNCLSVFAAPGTLDSLLRESSTASLRDGIAMFLQLCESEGNLPRYFCDAVHGLSPESMQKFVEIIDGSVEFVKIRPASLAVPTDANSMADFDKAFDVYWLMGVLTAPSAHAIAICEFAAKQGARSLAGCAFPASAASKTARQLIVETFLPPPIANDPILTEQLGIWTDESLFRILVVPKRWPRLTLERVHQPSTSNSIKCIPRFPWELNGPSTSDSSAGNAGAASNDSTVRPPAILVIRRHMLLRLPAKLTSGDIILIGCGEDDLDYLGSMVHTIQPFMAKSNLWNVPDVCLSDPSLTKAILAVVDSSINSHELESYRQHMTDLFPWMLGQHHIGCVLVR